MAYPTVNKKYMQTKYNLTKCANRRKNKSVKYIVVHYTGTTASARNNCIYFGGGNRGASADYFIDTDGSIYKFNGNCTSYYSWHCGDGYGKYGITNANSIGIEVVSKGSEFTAKQKASLRNLVRAIMADYGVKASNVVRHYDASRKSCPAPYCGSTAKNKKWATLKSYITSASGSSSSSSTSSSSTTKTTTSSKSSSKSLGKVNVTYALRQKGGSWLGTITNYNNKNGNGYAGYPTKSHTGFWAKVSKGSIKYRVHTVGGKWSSWKKDGAKITTKAAIDGIQIYYTTPSGYRYQNAWYRSQTTKRSGYLSACCDNGLNGYDGWCGIYGEPLDRIQISIGGSNPF